MKGKDFTEWMALKTTLQNRNKRRFGYNEGEIWWNSIGKNLGFEEDGKGIEYSRPVLILRGFSKELFWGIPLSTTKNRGKYYYAFTLHGKTSIALLSQLRTFDTLRLAKRYGKVGPNTFKVIKMRVHTILG